VSTPETATPIRGTTATTIAAARTIYPCDASLDEVYARANEQLDKAAREDLAAAGTIADAVVLVGQRQQRDLR
jgi:hypothetical protein